MRLFECSILVSVTDQGSVLANRATVAVEACDRAFFAKLGPLAEDFVTSLRTLQGPSS